MDWAPVADAVVVGAGHNGLVAANLLADAGWEVLVLEATGQPGGSVRTAALTAPGVPLRRVQRLLLPVRRLAEEEFRGSGGGLLLGGNALHADVGPEAPGSGFLGFLLCSLGQELGFPAVRGGAGSSPPPWSSGCSPAAASWSVMLRWRRWRCAVAVRTADGQVVPVGRAVIGAVDAITLYRRLIGEDHLPPAVVADLERFPFDNATVRSTGPCMGPCPGRPSRPARPAPCTWPTRWTSSPCTAPSWPAG
jgi:NAD(P)-binding Rossmann-like domain